MAESLDITRLATQFEATQRELEKAVTLPGVVYHHPSIFDIEIHKIFSEMWLCVGRSEQLTTPGRFVTRNIGDESILLTCDNRGIKHAFHNVCRHRGTRLVTQGSGNLRSVLCPYHAWNYDLSGNLLAAPKMGAGFCKEDHPLHTVRLAERWGFLFVTLDDNAPAIDEAFSDFPDVQRYGMEDLRTGESKIYEAKTNWKLVVENFSECYHCKLVHPQLHRVSRSRPSPTSDETGVCYNGGPMTLVARFTSLTTDGTTKRSLLPGLGEKDSRLIQYYTLYPNLLLSLHPDYVLSHVVWPVSPTQVVIQTDWLFSEDVVTGKHDVTDAVEFWDTTNRQDWQLCEQALKGLKSSGHIPGPYQPGESCVHAFDCWYGKRMTG